MYKTETRVESLISQEYRARRFLKCMKSWNNWEHLTSKLFKWLISRNDWEHLMCRLWQWIRIANIRGISLFLYDKCALLFAYFNVLTYGNKRQWAQHVCSHRLTPVMLSPRIKHVCTTSSIQSRVKLMCLLNYHILRNPLERGKSRN